MYKDLSYQERERLEHEAQDRPYLYMMTERKDSHCFNDKQYLTVTINPVWLHPEDGKPRNYVSGSLNSRDDLSNLQVSGQSYTYAGQTDWGNGTFQLEYADFISINLTRAEAMVKNLRSLDRKLTKLSERFGYCESFQQFAVRFGDVIGAVGAIKSVGRHTGNYTEGDYLIGKVSDVGYWLVTAMGDFKRELGE
jgi:hypothetical protein